MSFLLTAIVMFAFWFLLSGKTTLFFLVSGAVASLLVAYMSHDLLIGKTDIRLGFIRILRFIKYLPWLLWQVVLSNIDLVYRTLHPKMPISPGIVRFKNEFKTEMGMVSLAKSITLTPGTVTIEVNEKEFIVHAIAQDVAHGLISGEMQERVKKIEGEGNV